jgi:hypothetical protein
MRSMTSTVLALYLFAGCGGAGTAPTSVQLTVDRDPVGDENRSETTVSFHPPSPCEIIVEAEGQRSLVSFDANDPHGESPATVVLAATRQKDPEDGKVRVETLIRPRTPNGTSAGGPSTWTVDAEKPLAEVLDVSVKNGEFPLNEPIRLGTLNGEPVTLTVRPVNN